MKTSDGRKKRFQKTWACSGIPSTQKVQKDLKNSTIYLSAVILRYLMKFQLTSIHFDLMDLILNELTLFNVSLETPPTYSKSSSVISF